MAQFKAFTRGVEVNGETISSVLDGMGAFRTLALKILSESGIPHPQAGKWYPQQAWLDAFKVIAETVGEATLYAIGRKIPENAQFPPGIDTLEKALASIDVAYHMNHRGGEIGHYYYERTGERSAKMVCSNPYPCDFDRGIIVAMAKKFRPADALIIKVRHDDLAPCRKKGADSCTYIIEW